MFSLSGSTSSFGLNFWLWFFKKYLFIYFLEWKGGRKRRRETSLCGCLFTHTQLETWPTTQACALTGNRTSHSLVHSPHSIHRATSVGAPSILFSSEHSHRRNHLVGLFIIHLPCLQCQLHKNTKPIVLISVSLAPNIVPST